MAFAQQATSGYGVVPMYATTPTPTQQASAVTQAPIIGVSDGASNTVCKTYRVVSACPSRTVNPTYTPPTPLPSNYLWGCPPDKICYPQQGQAEGSGCNFEVGLPGPDYVCSPDQCVDPPRIIEQPEWADKMGKFILTPKYFYLDPRDFNKTYEEAYLWPGDDGKSFFPLMVIGELPPEAPLVTEVIKPKATTTETAIFTNTPSNGPAVTQTSEAASPAQIRRRDNKKDFKIPASCISYCNKAVEVAQNEHGSDGFCDEDSAYERKFATCRKCSRSERSNEMKDQGIVVMPNLTALAHECGDSLKLGDDNILERRGMAFFARGIDDVQSSNVTVTSVKGTDSATTKASASASASTTSKSGAKPPPVENAAPFGGGPSGSSVLAGTLLSFLAGWGVHV
ncbi:hypothetical protein KEM56_000754 [Ascosphaera pollenicola]|nr:hypothetical protein KEM56_000754 [Ascosphaera pollenicola]